MGPGAAHVEAFDRRTIITVAQDRARTEKLVEPERAVEDVAPDEPEFLLEIGRGADAHSQDAVGEVGRIFGDLFDDGLRGRIAPGFPGLPLRQFRSSGQPP